MPAGSCELRLYSRSPLAPRNTERLKRKVHPNLLDRSVLPAAFILIVLAALILASASLGDNRTSCPLWKVPLVRSARMPKECFLDLQLYPSSATTRPEAVRGKSLERYPRATGVTRSASISINSNERYLQHAGVTSPPFMHI